MIMVTVLAMAGLALNTNAQDLPMLRSKDALRTYALEQAANVSAQINASLPVGNNSYGFVPVESPTASGISNTIHDMSLSVDVANPNDSLFVWAGAYNADGDPLFTGYNQFSLVSGRGGYALPPDYGDVTLTLYDNIPIKVDGAQSAFIDILNANGQTEAEYSLNVQNDKVYFPRQLAGTNAILAVFTNSMTGISPGGWVYWNVGSGSSVQPEHFNVTLKPTIQGVVSVADQGEILVSVPTTNGIGYNLTLELKCTSAARTLSLASFQTTEGKWFRGAWIRKAGTSTWSWSDSLPDVYPNGKQVMAVYVYQTTGVYYIIPVWNDGDLVEPADPYYPPYNGPGVSSGGGGKG